MEFFELIQITFFGFLVFMTVVITGSFIIYKLRKKSKNPPTYNIPKVIVSKHNSEKKEVITLPPPKPAPLKVRADVQQPPTKKMQQIQVLQQTVSASQQTNVVNPTLPNPTLQQSQPVIPTVQVKKQISQQELPQDSSSQERPTQQYPQYGSSREQRPEVPATRPTIFRATGQSYPKVTQVTPSRQTSIKSPQDRFQIVNQPRELPQTSLSIAYYGVDRLSYQPPKYLKIVSPDQNNNPPNRY